MKTLWILVPIAIVAGVTTWKLKKVPEKSADWRLSPHFFASEFMQTETSLPAPVFERNSQPAIGLSRLCLNILEPLRAALETNYPGEFESVIITSGYRYPELNLEIGGSLSSQHQCLRKGEAAADVVVPNISPVNVIQSCFREGLPVDQAIEEFGRWAHLSVPPLGKAPRRQYLVASKGPNGTEYHPLS